MHKDFYASGFLYHPTTKQILLHQKPSQDGTPAWSLIGGIGLPSETAEAVFKRVVYELTRIKLNLKYILPVYTYYNKDIDKNAFLSYAHVEVLHDVKNKTDLTFGWFTTKQVFKLPLTPQTRHDITVAQRVIDSHMRKSLGQQTLE